MLVQKSSLLSPAYTRDWDFLQSNSNVTMTYEPAYDLPMYIATTETNLLSRHYSDRVTLPIERHQKFPGGFLLPRSITVTRSLCQLALTLIATQARRIFPLRSHLIFQFFGLKLRHFSARITCNYSRLGQN